MTIANPLADVFNDVLKISFLNFTHRAAHGGNDDVDVDHGDFTKLAASELEKLK